MKDGERTLFFYNLPQFCIAQNRNYSHFLCILKNCWQVNNLLQLPSLLKYHYFFSDYLKNTLMLQNEFRKFRNITHRHLKASIISFPLTIANY